MKSGDRDRENLSTVASERPFERQAAKGRQSYGRGLWVPANLDESDNCVLIQSDTNFTRVWPNPTNQRRTARLRYQFIPHTHTRGVSVCTSLKVILHIPNRPLGGEGTQRGWPAGHAARTRRCMCSIGCILGFQWPTGRRSDEQPDKCAHERTNIRSNTKSYNHACPYRHANRDSFSTANDGRADGGP